MGSTIDWAEDRIKSEKSGLDLIERTSEDFLLVQRRGFEPFPIAVINAQDVVLANHVLPALSHTRKPSFVVSVPSKAVWSGPAIELVHAAPASFGKMGEIYKAAECGYVPGYRNKTYNFFEQAIRHHSKVRSVTRLFDAVFIAHRGSHHNLTIVLIEAYNMSAEDVRNARQLYGKFDIAVKTTSYGAVTPEARQAANSMGAEAMLFREMMGRLAR